MFARSIVIVGISFLPLAGKARGTDPHLPSGPSANAFTTESVSLARRPTIPVTVVVMDGFGDPRLLGAVRRTTGANRVDLIVMRRSTMTPALLVALARTMRKAVARYGAVPTHPVNVYFIHPRHWQVPNSAEGSWANQIIAQLGVAQQRNLGKLGNQQAIDTVLEP